MSKLSNIMKSQKRRSLQRRPCVFCFGTIMGDNKHAKQAFAGKNNF